MNIEIISVVITLFSVIIALWFGIKSQRLARENESLQKRLLDIEEDREKDRKLTLTKAQLNARIEQRDGHNYRLLIENLGNAAARNIDLKLDGIPFDNHGVAVNGDVPLNNIGPKSSATRMLAITTNRAPPFELEINWDDDSNEPGAYRTTLTF